MLEDSSTDAELIQRLLLKEKMHCEFKVTMDKKDFEKALTEFSPGVILSDNSLPQFNALQALKIARSHFPHVPFILVTGTVSDEYAADVIKQGADDYILKDRLTRLPTAIDTALRHRRAEKEKQEASKKLKQSEEKYRTIMERLSDAFIALDKDWQYTYVNKKAGEILNREPNDLIGKNIWVEFPESVEHPFYKACHKAMEQQQNIYLEAYYEPFHAWLENYIYPSPDGLSIFFRDVTEKKNLEAELLEQQKREQLKITATALEAQEKERNAIGQELHDNVNQILVGTKLFLSMVKDNPEKNKNLIVSSINSIQSAIDENRKIAHALVAPDFKTNSLADQINDLTETMFRISNVDVIIDTDRLNENLLDEEQKLAIYRIAQEQCTNIIKYAKASQVNFSLNTTNKRFRIIIADNGLGMKKDKGTKGIGLKNINARLSIFNGEAAIKTAPGEGFILDVTMPLKKDNGSIHGVYEDDLTAH
jgi:PAS domain S-box-containing protein